MNDALKFAAVFTTIICGTFVGFYVVVSLTTNPLLLKVTAVKNRLQIVITQPGFTNPVPQCDFFERRQQMSDEYRQLTVNYDVFQHGKETRGDIEAYVEIYNKANETYVSLDTFTVEVSRNGWNELTIYLDGANATTFETVHEDNLPQFGYVTFQVYQP